MDNLKYRIVVMSETGRYYTNARIENSHDAVLIAKYYREVLGYDVILFDNDKDISYLIDGATIPNGRT